MSCEDNFDSYLKRLQTNRINQEKSGDVLKFQVDFLDLLEAGKGEEGEQNEPDSSQELDNFISAEKSANTVRKTNS